MTAPRAANISRTLRLGGARPNTYARRGRSEGIFVGQRGQSVAIGFDFDSPRELREFRATAWRILTEAGWEVETSTGNALYVTRRAAVESTEEEG
jgi:hypothetical protein